jgi:cytochrome-b5 reductase
MTDYDSLFLIVATAVAVLVGFLFLLKSKQKQHLPTVLPLDDFRPFQLIRKEVLSHDTARFTFGLPVRHVLGLPTGQHISLRFLERDQDGTTGTSTQVIRSYTPVTDNNTVGEVSLVIKIYKAGVHPKFPDGGKMSQHLDSLKIGDTIDIKGPKGHMEYLGKGGNFWVKPIGKPKSTRQASQFIMIAGGTGITPMLQVLNYMFRNPGNEPNHLKATLLYANQSKYWIHGSEGRLQKSKGQLRLLSCKRIFSILLVACY